MDQIRTTGRRCAAIAASVLAATALHAGQWLDYYVDNSWTGAVLGTSAAPFTNIQAAIDFTVFTDGMFAASTIYVKPTGSEYTGLLLFPNLNAMRLKGWGGMPTIAYRGGGPHSTIMSDTNYGSPVYACLPPAQVGLETLAIINDTSAPGDWYCADVQPWVSWEPGLTNTPERYRFGVSNCIFYGAGRNGGLKLRDLDQRHLVPSDIPYFNYHTSLVQRCRFEQCRVGVKAMSLQFARIADNWFVSNAVAITAVQSNFWPYIRPYTNLFIAFNVFESCAGDAVQADNFNELIIQNNTFYQGGGTGAVLNAVDFDYHGTAQLHNNIFYDNGGAWIAAAEDTNALIAGNNLYYANPETGWEAFGTGSLTNVPPDFVSQTPGDPDFLRPNIGSPAAYRTNLFGGVTFLGALPPLPEPGALLALPLLLVRRAARRNG